MSNNSYLIESAVELEHVLGNVSRFGPLSLADEVAFRIGGPRGVRFVNANLLKSSIHQVDQTDAIIKKKSSSIIKSTT